MPHIGDARADQLEIQDLSAIPVLRQRLRHSPRLHAALKRVGDACLASVLVVLTAPLWVLAIILIRLESPGPVFFTHERVGLNGRLFRILKFRTMRIDADPYAHSPMGDVDSRITRVGRFLRAGGIDELPQLLNVIRGDMSIVGPRPEMPFIVERYTALDRERLKVRPGITGLWQLSPDRHTEIHENLEYDLYYVGRQTFLLDVLILLETVFFSVGAIVRHAWETMRRNEPDRGAPESLAEPAPENEPPLATDWDTGSVPTVPSTRIQGKRYVRP